MIPLLKYLKPYRTAALLAPLLMLVEVLMDLMQPKLVASIVDQGIMTGDLGHIQRTGLLMIGLALIGMLGGIGCTIYASIASQHFGADIRADLFQHIQRFSFHNLDRFSSGSLITRLTNDVVQLQNLVLMALRMLVRSPLLSIGSLIMAFTISFKLAIILLIAMPILLVTLIFIMRKAFPIFGRVQAELDRVNTVTQENLAGIRVIKAFVRAIHENKRYDAVNQDYTNIAIKANRMVALIGPIMMLIMDICIVAVLWFGGGLTKTGALPVGDLIAFINYATQVLMSLMMVSMTLMSVSRATASAERINEVLHTEPDITAPAQTVTPDPQQVGRLEFRDVSFAYDGDSPAVLDQISFVATAGQTIAILGATGAGKSSLVHLIPRMYDVTNGAVLVDDVNVRQWDLDQLRSSIGIVLQQALLFSGSIRDNIRYGRPNASQEEVESAARAAQAHEFIEKLPEGYDTLLGQRGVNLSGGQKQRLSIARALLIQPPLLIMDDSTSAVDLRTEALIQKALEERLSASTRFIIAQRITSVLDADLILIMEDGQIIDRGDHAYLIKNSQAYQEIYRSQLGQEVESHG
ncbi:multidrug ABC transporter ATP-binding protein [Paenibacillus sp. CFBP13512]|uniref:ABC transporter ATP-binding protein n=1 Tax=Paenibacillus sp. CFBP13512 TaxID=2184007 RepID=UPI0010C0F826|nr:ABC transporter ATP-binding protein [Paenibacillus sp. CFBP13512]TKJ91024.1 multidrug ABC transporter ATP-binding protein [Paenibacillus sp. CFBP13512]